MVQTKSYLTKLNRLTRVIPFIISAGLVYILFKRINILEFIAAFHQISFLNLLIALMLDIPFVLLKSYKWHRIVRIAIPDVRFSQAIVSFLLGAGASLFTPAQLGELVRAVSFNANRKKIIILTLIDKLIDFVVLGLLVAISILFICLKFGIMLGFGWLTFMIIFIIWKWKFEHNSFNNFQFLFLVSLSLVSGICFMLLMLQFHVILLDFTDAGFWNKVIGLPLILVTGMLPVTISGLGLRETVASIILPQFGIGEVQAATASFLLFLVNGLIPGLVGIILGLKRISVYMGFKVKVSSVDLPESQNLQKYP